jgi:predicted DCC family thiol-disulfide oxidoreductase YuxK
MSSPESHEPDMVFYDGGCGLCHRAVRVLVVRDADGTRFTFAPLGGRTALERLEHTPPVDLPDSIIVLTATGDIFIRSRAVIRLLRRLGGIWRPLSALLGLVPVAIGDRAYDLVAASRTRLFARPGDTCPVVPPELRKRFLP